LDILRHNHPVTIKGRANQWIGFDSQLEPPRYDDFGQQREVQYVVPQTIGRFPYVRLNLS
jgi:hypothetical protein